ncbi:MAG TPA: L-rhamnose/proton symporter RhaT, partial [Solimonas sp.]|nr:L-rhamnose/proton symporter RhaT [Solimonas sp.]
GFGGLTFGLTMRYLGMSLGMAVALGLTTVIGTLAPPIFAGQLLSLAATRSGAMTLLGIAITIVGFIVVSSAGRAKERELAGGAGSQSVTEFDFRKGLLIAIFSGVMSSCFAFGLAAGEPIRQLTLAAGTDPLSQGLPVLCVVLLGGFTTNFVWCLLLIRRHRSGAQLLSSSTPLLRNYLLCAIGGTAWYFQFFFYTMGESQMGRFGFSSWTLHMASIIIFSTLWGFALSEWKGSAPAIRRRVQLGIALLVASTLVIGYGNYLGV